MAVGRNWRAFCIFDKGLIMKKSKVIETLDTLPEDFKAEELIERLIFIDKVEKGLQEVEEGRTISLEEAKERVRKKWSK